MRLCLQKDPSKRIRDIGSVRLALDGAFDAPVMADSARRRRPPMARAAWTVTAVLAVALGGALVAWRFPGAAPAVDALALL